MIYLGCSGYHYSDWVGRFYPKTLSTDEYLKYYANFFNSVEINSSFYKFPDEALVKRWLGIFEGSTGFTFSFKFPKTVTHNPDGINFNSIQEASNFQDKVLFQFSEKGLLGSALLQFSPYFEPNRVKNWEILLSNLLDSLDTKNIRIAVEVRNKNFLSRENLDNLLNILRERNVSLATIDSPAFPFLNYNTSSFSYIRLHGRNLDLWYGKGNLNGRLNKYDYLYKEQELLEIARQIGNLKGDIFIYFNNHAQGKAAENALTLSKMMGLNFKKINNQRTLVDF